MSAVIAMAHGLRFRDAAECAETPEQVRFPRKCGCDEIRSIYFCHPVPAAELAAFAAGHGGRRLEVVGAD